VYRVQNAVFKQDEKVLWVEDAGAVIREGPRLGGGKRNSWPFYRYTGMQKRDKGCDAGQICAYWLEKVSQTIICFHLIQRQGFNHRAGKAIWREPLASLEYYLYKEASVWPSQELSYEPGAN
jgi:hypothetical protein